MLRTESVTRPAMIVQHPRSPRPELLPIAEGLRLLHRDEQAAATRDHQQAEVIADPHGLVALLEALRRSFS